jgi:hypothetical protein
MGSIEGATHATLFGARSGLPPRLCSVRRGDGLPRTKALVSIPVVADAIEGQPAVPMTATHRSLFVGLGALLIVISVLLAAGVIR